MLARLLYSIQQAKCHSKALSAFAKNKSHHYACITDIPLEYFAQHHIKIIALDFDGVLAAHGELKVHGAVMIWLEKLIKAVGVDQICLLSNKPTMTRKRFFEDHYPGLAFIAGERKKPYPDGLKKIMALKSVRADEVCLIDDRLLTGILATIISGSKGILITKPFQNYQGHLVKESFFAFLRFMECCRFGLKR